MATTRWNGIPWTAAAVQTVGATTTTVVSIDLSAPGVTGALDTASVHVEAVLIGRESSTTSGVTMRGTRAFESHSSTLTALGALVMPIAAQGSAALLTAAMTIDNSGRTVRLRATGIALLTIDWTGYLYVWSGDFTG